MLDPVTPCTCITAHDRAVCIGWCAAPKAAAVLREPLLHILQHSLGLDRNGQGTAYRNRFVTGPDVDNYPLCRELVELGFMAENPPREWLGGMSTFIVTEAGRAAVSKQSPPAPKRTQSQKRYQAFLDADTGLTFGEWLRRGATP